VGVSPTLDIVQAKTTIYIRKEMSQRNEVLQFFLGILFLFGMHIISAIAIFLLGYIISPIFGNYTFLGVWIYAAYGFFLIQLLYVIPVTLWLRRQQRIGMMKGMIVGAVITALLNGSCFLLLNR
jgi:Na+/proline symporter